MNWVQQQQESVDQYLNSTMYGGISQADGIDLRIEINRLLYGTGTQNAKGHYVIVRKFDRTKHSQYWKDCTKEGVGGPGYFYLDILLKTRRVPIKMAGDSLLPTKAGIDVGDRYLYYFEYTLKPRRGDQIFELDWDDHRVQPDINNVSLLEKYSIDKVHPYRLEFGRVEYYACAAEFDEVAY
jgi:hypothetical protein